MYKKNLLFTYFLFLISMLLQSCSSMTDFVVKPQSLNKKAPYASIKLEKNDSATGQLVKLCYAHNAGNLSAWEAFVDKDSTGKSVSKMMYCMTPWGMMTNLATGKGLLGQSIYHVPAGQVKLLVFNYHSKIIGTSTTAFDEAKRINNMQMSVDQQSGRSEQNNSSFDASPSKKKHLIEYAHWGTVLVTQLEAGHTYTLTTQKFQTLNASTNEVSAYVSLIDEKGHEAVSQYVFLTPIDVVNVNTFTVEINDLNLNAPSGPQGVVMANQLMPAVNKYLEEFGRFMQEVNTGRYDDIVMSAEIPETENQ